MRAFICMGICLVIGIGIRVYHLFHPSLTEAQMFIKSWPMIAVALAFAGFGIYFTQQKGKTDER